MQIHEAPHGINLVVETPDTVYIGRFDHTDGFQVLMHDVSIHKIEDNGKAEDFVRQTAKYGVAVDQRDVMFDASIVRNVRVLGDVPQD